MLDEHIKEKRSQMKVLFVFSIHAGGMQTLNFERKLALSKKGLICHFLYFKKRPAIDTVKDNELFFTNDENEIRNLINQQQYDAIIVCVDYAFLKTLRKLGYKGRIIYDFQGIGSKAATENWLERSKTDVMNYADGILYPKTNFLDELMKEHFPNKKLFSFHNCIDTDLFDYVEVPKPKNTILGWVGRLDANKNWQEFLLAGASLQTMIPPLQLWLFHDPTVCTNTSLKAFSKWVKRLNLTHSLDIYENIPRTSMPKYYSLIAKSGGLLCSTSKQEGFGYAVIEAMCCRCPVLTTKSGGVESFVMHNVTGKYYEQGNMNNFVNEAYNMIQNLKSREEMINHAYELVRTNFTPKHYSQNFVQMLQNLTE
jgi:glycosyltransferase involved in cell wall biosynthesis